MLVFVPPVPSAFGSSGDVVGIGKGIQYDIFHGWHFELMLHEISAIEVRHDLKFVKSHLKLVWLILHHFDQPSIRQYRLGDFAFPD